MMEHSSLGASNSKRWMNCAGSPRMEENAPKDTGGDSPASLLGTAAHKCGEMCLENETDAWLYMGEEFVPGYPVDDEMIEAVQIYVDYVRHIMSLDKKAELHLETKIRLDHISTDPAMFGTADCLVWCPTLQTLYSVDYKHGVGVYVPEAANSQLCYYALGALYHLGLYDADVRVITTVVQPRYPNAEAIRSWETTSRWLCGQFEEHLTECVEATKQPQADLVPGDWCRFCRAKGGCPAKADSMQAHAVEVFKDIPIGLEFPAPSTLSPERIQILLDAEKGFTQFFKSVREYAFQAQADGLLQVPKYDIVPGRKSRKWRDEEEVKKKFEKKYGQRIFTDPDLKSPAQLEKIVGKKEVEDLVETTQGVSFKRVEETRVEVAVKAFLEHKIEGEEG